MRKNSHPIETKDYDRARQLRREASKYEQKLWFALREATAGMNLKFRRQQPIHPYIADFACMKAKLLIELDGMSHDNRQAYDQARDTYLRQQGYIVLRISNDEIGCNLSGVIEMIVTQAKSLLPQHPLTKKI